MLGDRHSYIDLPYLRKQKLTEATHRYKVCLKCVEYLKTLGYFHDLSFNAFLHPNLKDTRRLLGFLFDIIFKDEEAEKMAQRKKEPTNQADEVLRRRLQAWKQKAWIMPDFVKGTRRNLLVGGELLVIDPKIDLERVAGCKSKKTKQMYQHMVGTLQEQIVSDQYAQGMNLLGLALDSQAWQRGQRILIKNDSGQAAMFHDDSEDDDTNSGAKQSHEIASVALSNFSE